LRNFYKILVITLKGKDHFAIPRSRWEGNIRMDRREIAWEGIDWMNLAQDREQWRALVDTIMNRRIAQKAGYSSTSWVTVNFSRKSLLHRVSYFAWYNVKPDCKMLAVNNRIIKLASRYDYITK
jgi:hypothetical protein